jgi:hypothetical protein
MRLNRTVLAGMVLAGVTALFFIGGCTNASTRADLTVVSVNDGATYYSDLLNEADTAHLFIPIDQVVVKFGNHPHDGSAPLDPGSGFSEIVVNHYSVVYDNGVYSPISGGMNVVVPSGGTAEGAITISNPSEKGALLGTLTSTVTSTATITFSGYVRTTGNFGDFVGTTASLTVQVDNFGDSEVNQ